MRKKKEKEEIDTQSWMISFNDLLTLMLTFFVLLFSMSSMNNKHFKVYLDSLRGVLGNFGTGRLTSIGKPKILSDVVFPTQVSTLLQDALIRALLANSENLDDKPFFRNQNNIEIYSTTKFAQILFPGLLFFKKNSVDISPQMAQRLEEIIPILKKYAYPIRINGYSHQEKNSGERQRVTNLSLKRAATILHFLISKGGIAPERCSLADYGCLRKEKTKTKIEDYVEIFIVKPTIQLI